MARSPVMMEVSPTIDTIPKQESLNKRLLTKVSIKVFQASLQKYKRTVMLLILANTETHDLIYHGPYS